MSDLREDIENIVASACDATMNGLERAYFIEYKNPPQELANKLIEYIEKNFGESEEIAKHKVEALRYTDEIFKESENDMLAHSLEDDAYEWFVRMASFRKDGIGEIAKILIRTKGIVFGRWFG